MAFTQAAAACGSSSSAPAASAPITVQGAEHLAWNQAADNTDEISRYMFVAYVDDASIPLPDAGCPSALADSEFDCSARLPPMSPGAHRLQIATAVVVDGVRFESPRSTALNLVVVPTAGNASSTSNSRQSFTASDGTSFIVETVARGLDAPSALDALPDGRVFVAERTGAVRVWKDGRILATPALRLSDAASQTDTGLVGIAIHPDFNKNGQVFVAYTARASDGTFVNRVVRFRELNDVLDQPAVLLEDTAVSAPHRAARIRFGPDGKLYVAFAADAATAQDPTAYGGKILRLNVDGTTPRDNPSYSPILPDDIGVPLAFGWQPATSSRWQIDRDWSNREMLMASRTSGGARSLATTIAPAIDPSGAAFYGSRAITGFNGDLFISALAGRQIQRVRFDTSN